MTFEYLPQDYKKRRQVVAEYGVAKTGQVSPQGTAVQIEHWDGSMDATVRPRAMGLKMTAGEPGRQDPRLVDAVLALETAIKEHTVALNAGKVDWQQRTARKVQAAKRKVIELQEG